MKIKRGKIRQTRYGKRILHTVQIPEDKFRLIAHLADVGNDSIGAVINKAIDCYLEREFESEIDLDF